MATGRRPDPRRRKDRHEHATYLKVGNGQKEPAYIAGPLFGCYSHRTHATQPCYLDVTNDELECPYCKASMEAVWRGYVPLWDRDWTLRYALIGEDYFASVDSIPHREQVSVTRAKNPISPLVIRQERSLLRDLPDREPWSKEVNMLDVCLTLWKIDALSEWFRKNPPPKKASVNGVSLKPDGTPFSPIHQAAGRKAGARVVEPGDAGYDEVLEQVKQKAARMKTKESSNGKHG